MGAEVAVGELQKTAAEGMHIAVGAVADTMSGGKKTTKRIRKFRTTVYPSNKAPFASKLCENAFQTIPNILFFDVVFRIFFVLNARFTTFLLGF